MKPCTKCGSVNNGFYANKLASDGLQSWCKKCHCSDTRIRERSNPEKKKEYLRRTLERNPLLFKIAQEKYRSKPGIKERRAEESRRYRSMNRDRMNELTRKWFKANRDAANAYARNRRALVANSTGSHTKDEVSALLVKQEGRCVYCRAELTKYHADHIMPISLGGSNDIGNIQLLCPFCNMSKRNKHPDVFLASLR